MIIKMNQTSVLHDIKTELETYLLTQSFISLKRAEKKYQSYKKRGGNKPFDEIKRSVFREFALGNAW